MICPVHDRPGRCPFGSMVVCDWCDAGYPADHAERTRTLPALKFSVVLKGQIVDRNLEDLADELERKIFETLDNAEPQPWNDDPFFVPVHASGVGTVILTRVHEGDYSAQADFDDEPTWDGSEPDGHLGNWYRDLGGES